MMGHEWSPSDVVMVIGAIFAGIGSIISAWKSTQAKNVATEGKEIIESAQIQAQVNSQKIDEVHTLTNGNLTKTQEELEVEKKKTLFLEKLVIELADKCPPGELERAKKRLEEKQAKIGKRRKTDLLRDKEVKEREEDRV